MRDEQTRHGHDGVGQRFGHEYSEASSYLSVVNEGRSELDHGKAAICSRLLKNKGNRYPYPQPHPRISSPLARVSPVKLFAKTSHQPLADLQALLQGECAPKMDSSSIKGSPMADFDVNGEVQVATLSTPHRTAD